MVYSLGYRRPSHVNSSRESQASVSDDEKQRSLHESVHSGSSCMSHGIPEALNFDRIVSGGTCPPCTVRDFMNYLKYIEHSAENLQFYLWYRNYCARWEKLASSEQALAPVWTQAQAEAEVRTAQTRPRLKSEVAAILRGTDFENHSGKPNTDKVDPFHTPSKYSIEEKQEIISDYASSNGDDKPSPGVSSYAVVADQAFDDAGLKWKPFTTQPYRDEINHIISTYIAEGSLRELNLSARERISVLRALQITTHPSAFRFALYATEYALRKQAHPNFIRWTICNGNRPRVVFARGLGIFFILVGFAADLTLTLSSAGRGYRVIPIIAWMLGISTLIAAWKGMCVVLHGMHHRHLRPWELFVDAASDANQPDEVLLFEGAVTINASNSYEDEPWIAKYSGRNLIRKIFDREVWVQEPALRQIQDTIFVQAILGALLLSCVIVGIFCAVPHGNLF